MSKILVIGAAGLIGERGRQGAGRKRVHPRVAQFGRTRRHLGSQIARRAVCPDRNGRRDYLHGRRCALQAVGRADRRGLDVLPRQQIVGPGQCRPLWTEVCPARRRDHAHDGLASQYPAPGSAIITTVNSASSVCRAVAAEPRFPCGSSPCRPAGSQRHCRRWAAIRRTEFLPPKWPRSRSGNFARARRGRWSRQRRSKTPFASASPADQKAPPLSCS